MKTFEQCEGITHILQLRAREGYWQKLLKPRFNRQMAGRSQAQWHRENLDKKRANFKKHYENNTEKIQNRKMEKIECECGCMISRSNMSYHRQTKKHQTWAIRSVNDQSSERLIDAPA